VEEVSGIAAGTVLVGVWKACEKELVRLTELFSSRISQWYGDSDISLECTTSDIESAFRKQRLGPWRQCVHINYIFLMVIIPWYRSMTVGEQKLTRLPSQKDIVMHDSLTRVNLIPLTGRAHAGIAVVTRTWRNLWRTCRSWWLKCAENRRPSTRRKDPIRYCWTCSLSLGHLLA